MSSPELIVSDYVAGVQSRRFAVAWRNTTLKQIHAVGVLAFDRGVYRFRYLVSAADVPGFRPFIGFPKIGENYHATRLWPFFALRAMDSRRPDFTLYVERLGLTKDATVLDILSRSGGEVQGDVSVNLVEEPLTGNDGTTEYVFLVRGARHAAMHYHSAEAIDILQPGDVLTLRPDASNPVNGEALLVATVQGTPIGWVPDLLTPYFQALAERGAEFSVLRNNGLGAPWHLRLLVRASGRTDPALPVFAGPQWTAGRQVSDGTTLGR
jgi:hypothetical protein